MRLFPTHPVIFFLTKKLIKNHFFISFLGQNN